jgi:hypothetical protein
MNNSIVTKYLEKKFPQKSLDRYNGVLYFIGNVMYWEHKKAFIPLLYIQTTSSNTHPNSVSEMMYIISTHIDEFKHLVFNSELTTTYSKFKEGYGYYNIVDNTVYTLYNGCLVKIDEHFIDTVVKEIESLSEFVIVSEESSSSDSEELVVVVKEELCSDSYILNEDVEIIEEVVKEDDDTIVLTDSIKNDILKMISNLIGSSVNT